MNESEAERSRSGRRMMSDADATGFRRPLPHREQSGFSMNGGAASANGAAERIGASDDLVHSRMERAPSGRERWLHDWPLALKSILLFWTFYFLLTSTRAFLLDTPGQAEMMRRRAVVAVIACLICAAVYLLLRLFARSSMRTRIIVAAVAALPAASLLAAANHYWFYLYSPLEALWVGPKMDGMNDWSLTKIIADGTHSWYFFVGAWAAIYVALSTARQLRESDQRAAMLAHEAQEAQLRALRYQINPHFLFNTLNSLSSLVLADRNETAERMLMNLSAFFRTTLSADPTADVPLAEEIRLQQLYLEIEQVRFPERLHVEIDVPERLMDRRVPALILQPVVENSVKYGVARARRPVTLRISAFEEAGRLHIKVKDDGEGCPAAEDGDSTGVGLRNVCERLASRFGKSAGCIHGADPDGGYTVQLFLPVVSHD